MSIVHHNGEMLDAKLAIYQYMITCLEDEIKLPNPIVKALKAMKSSMIQSALVAGSHHSIARTKLEAQLGVYHDIKSLLHEVMDDELTHALFVIKKTILDDEIDEL